MKKIFYDNGTMVNKLGIQDAQELEKTEYLISSLRASELLEKGSPSTPKGLADLQEIHSHLFSELFDWAGEVRSVPSSKRMANGMVSVFEAPEKIVDGWREIEKEIDTFNAEKHGEKETVDFLTQIFIKANALHPFMEGNGRSLQIFMTQLAKKHQIRLDFTEVDPGEWNHASAVSGTYGRLFERVHLIPVPPDTQPIQKIFEKISHPIIKPAPKLKP